jgi:hypothetical protein
VTAPVGACVGLFYDPGAELERLGAVLVGDFIVTPTRRCYLVMAVRIQQRGLRAGRHHLRCLVQREAPPGARVWTLRWYPRGRR